MDTVVGAREGHAERPGHDRTSIESLGLWIFIASEAFLFLVLISTRFALVGFERPADLNQLLGAAVTVVLLSSSVSAYAATRALTRGDTSRFRLFVRITLTLGIVFLAGLALEWAEGFAAFPPARGYGSVFFTLTGFHGAHVASGLLILWLATRRVRDPWPARAAVRYWTFVDAVWLLIYPTLYLL